MPLYEYQCAACGRRFEVIRKFSDPPLETCSLCGSGSISRLPSSPAIQFKGSGFYITDYAKKGEGRKGEGGRGEEGMSDKTSTEKSQDAKSDAAAADKAGKTESKTEGKSEGKTETAAKADAPAKSDAPAKGNTPAKPSPPSSTPSGGSKD